jgi:Inner membrane component of T3SS, cytoplasmic domain
MASLVIESAGFAGRVIELNLGANRFGRGPENEFQIEHPSVSDRHCDLVLAHNGIIVRDWASAKGTFIDGDRIKEAKLAPGQVLRLGQVELRVEKTEITVAIPEFTVPRQENSTVASLSVLFCSRHPATPATHRCSRCHKALCVTCARRVRRSGGRMVTLCSHCQGPCELVCSRQCGARATHQCTRCGKAVCDNCVRKLRRQGGKVLKICPLCTQECVLICPRHPEARAIYRCTHCEVGVCLDCARFTRRRGDPTSRVCPFCHYPCVLMCASHPEALATHHCNHCHKLLCPACVQQLRNHRGQIMRFCCHCSQPCAPVRDKMPRGKSLLDRLQAKVRTALRRGRKKAKTSRST